MPRFEKDGYVIETSSPSESVTLRMSGFTETKARTAATRAADAEVAVQAEIAAANEQVRASEQALTDARAAATAAHVQGAEEVAKAKETLATARRAVKDLGEVPAEESQDTPADKPAGNASLEAWQEYATAQGVDVEGKSRDDLRAEFEPASLPSPDPQEASEPKAKAATPKGKADKTTK